MPQFTVHLYPQVRVTVHGVDAESQEAAIEKAIADTNFHALLDTGEIEYAEEIKTAHVDESGDDEYLHSHWYEWSAETGWTPDTV